MPEFSINPHSITYLEEGQFLSGFQTAITRSEQLLYVWPLLNKVKEYAGTLKALSGNQTSIVEIRSVAKQLRTELQAFKAEVSVASKAIESEGEGFIQNTRDIANTVSYLERVQTIKAYLINVNMCIAALIQLTDSINECKIFRIEFDRLMLTADVLDPTNQDEVGAFAYNARSLIAPCKQVKDIVADLFSIEKDLLLPLKRLVIHKDLQYQIKLLKGVIFQDILISSLNAWLSEIRKSSSLFGCKLMVLTDQEIVSTNRSFSRSLQELTKGSGLFNSKSATAIYNMGTDETIKPDEISIETTTLLNKLSTLSRSVRNECYFDYVNEILAISELLGFKEEAISHIVSVRQKQEPITDTFDYAQYMDSLEGKKTYERVYSYIGYFFFTDLLTAVVPTLYQSTDELSAARFAMLLCRLCDDYCKNPHPLFILEFHRIILCLRFLKGFPRIDDIVTYFMNTCLKEHCNTQSIKYQASVEYLIQNYGITQECNNSNSTERILSLRQKFISNLLQALKGHAKETVNDTTLSLQRYIYYETLQRAVALAIIILKFTFGALLFFFPSCSILTQYQSDSEKVLALITFVCTEEPSPSALAALRCTQEQVDINILLDHIFTFLLINVHPRLIGSLSDVSQTDLLTILNSLYMFKGLDISLRLVSKVIFTLYGSQELCRPFNDIIDPLYASMFSSLSYVIPDVIVRSLNLFAATNQPIDFVNNGSIDMSKILPGTLSIQMINNYSSEFPIETQLPLKLHIERYVNYLVAAIRFLPIEFVSQLIKVIDVLLVDAFLHTVSKSTVLRMPAAGGLRAFCADLKTLQKISITTGIYYELSCRNTIESLSSLYDFEESESMRPPKQRMFIVLATKILEDVSVYGGFKIGRENEVVLDKQNQAIAELSNILRTIESNDRTISLLNAFQLDNPQSLQVLRNKCYEIIGGRSSDSNSLSQREKRLIRMLVLLDDGFKRMQIECLEYASSVSSTIESPEKPFSTNTPETNTKSACDAISPQFSALKDQGSHKPQLNAKIKTQFLSIFAPKRTGKKQEASNS